MKQFLKHSKSLVALMLAMIMLLGTVLPVFAGIDVGGTPPENGGSGEEVVLDAGWFVIETTADGITAVIHPDKFSLTDIGVGELKTLLGDVISSLKVALGDKVHNTLLPEGYEKLDADSIWAAAVSSYVNDEYAHIADELDRYAAFFDDIMTSDEKVNDLSAHTCDMIKLAVWAGLDQSSLPDPQAAEIKDDLAAAIKSFVKLEVDKIITEELEGYIDSVINDEVTVDSELDELIHDNLSVYFENVVEKYVDHRIDGESVEHTPLNDYVHAYIDEHVKAELTGSAASLESFAESYMGSVAADPDYTLASPTASERYVAGYTDKYIENRIKEYVNARKTGVAVVADELGILIADTLYSEISPSADRSGFDSLGASEFRSLFDGYAAPLGYTEDELYSHLRKKVIAKAGENGSDFSEVITSEVVSDAIDALFTDDNSDALSSVVDQYLGDVISDEASYDELLGSVLSELDADGMTEALIEDALDSENLVGKVLHDVLNIGTSADDASDVLDQRISEIADIVHGDYLNTYNAIRFGDGEWDLKDLLSVFGGLWVDGLEIVNKDIELCKDNILALIGRIPTAGELSVMEPEQMFVEYDVLFKSEFADIGFNFRVEMASDCEECDEEAYDKLRNTLKVFDEYFRFSYNEVDKVTSVYIGFPELLTDAVVSAINKGTIPDSIKDKIINAFPESDETGLGFAADLTVDDLAVLLDEIDFTGIISSDNDVNNIRSVLSGKFGIDSSALSDDDVKNKAIAIENVMNSVKDKISENYEDIFLVLPEEYRTKTLSQLYRDTSGDTGFGLNDTIVFEESTVNKIQSTIMDRFKANGLDYDAEITYLFGILDLVDYSLDLDFSIGIDGLHKVTYTVSDSEFKVGFLPENSDPLLFVKDVASFEGIAIEGWYLEDGVTAAPSVMPENDLVLVAKLADVEILIKAEDSFVSTEDGFVIVFDGKSHYITAEIADKAIIENPNVKSYKYKWYKNGSEIAEGDKLEISDFEDVDSYKCVFEIEYNNGTVIESLAESQVFDVAVTLPTLTANVTSTAVDEYTYRLEAGILGITDEVLAYVGNLNYQWFYSENGESFEAISGADASSLEVFGNSKNGVYKCILSFTVAGKALELESNVIDVSVDKIVITSSDIFDLSVFDYTDPSYIIIHDGNSHSVIFEESDYPVTITGYEESAPGEYTATAVINDDAKADYKFEGDVASLTLKWHIVENATLSITPENPNFVYNGSPNQIKAELPESLLGFTAEYKWYKVVDGIETLVEGADTNILGLVNVSDSGEYKCVVTLDSYGLSQTASATVTVNITPKVIDFNGFVWYAPENFVYDGKYHDVTVVTVPDEYKDIVVVDYDSLVEGVQTCVSVKRPGSYTVAPTLLLLDNENYVFIEGEVPDYNFEISKAEFDFSKVVWSNAGPFVYSEGKTYSVYLKGFEFFTFEDIVIVYSEESVNEAVEIGDYKAIFKEFRVKDGDNDYPLTDYYTPVNADNSGFAPTLDWSIIIPAPPVIPGLEFEHDEGDIYVKVEDSEGVLRGCYMRVVKRNIDYVTLSNGKNYKIASAYEIVFVDNEGNLVEYSGEDNFDVTFKVPKGIDLSKLELLYVGDTTEENEIVNCVLSEDGTELYFTTTHFSVYAIATEHIGPIPPPVGPDTPPDTPPDESSDFVTIRHALIITGGILLLALLILFIGIYIIKNRRYTKFRKSLLVNEYEETVELYEDLKPLEWGAPESVFVDGERPKNVRIDETMDDFREKGAHVNVEHKPLEKEYLEKTIGYIKETPDERIHKTISRVEALIPEVNVRPNPIVVGPEIVGMESAPTPDTRKIIAKAKVKGVDPAVLAALGLQDTVNQTVSEVHEQPFIPIQVIDDSEAFEEAERNAPMMFTSEEPKKKRSRKNDSPVFIPMPPNTSVEKDSEKVSNTDTAYIPFATLAEEPKKEKPPVAPMTSFIPFATDEVKGRADKEVAPVAPIVIPLGKNTVQPAEAKTAPIFVPIANNEREEPKQDNVSKFIPIPLAEEKAEASAPEAPIVIPVIANEEKKTEPKAESTIIPVPLTEEKVEANAPEAPIVIPVLAKEEEKTEPKAEPTIIPVPLTEEKNEAVVPEAPIVIPVIANEEEKTEPKAEPTIIPVPLTEEKNEAVVPEAPIVIPVIANEEKKTEPKAEPTIIPVPLAEEKVEANASEAPIVIPVIANEEEKTEPKAEPTIIPVPLTEEKVEASAPESPVVIPISTDERRTVSPVAESPVLIPMHVNEENKKEQKLDSNVIPLLTSDPGIEKAPDNSSTFIPMASHEEPKNDKLSDSGTIIPLNNSSEIRRTKKETTDLGAIPISSNNREYIDNTDGSFVIPIIISDKTEGAAVEKSISSTAIPVASGVRKPKRVDPDSLVIPFAIPNYDKTPRAVRNSPVMIPVSEGKASAGAANTASPVMIPVSGGKTSAGAANTASPVMIPVSEGKTSAGSANTASPVMIPVSEGKASAGAANTASPVMIPVSEGKASAGGANTASPVMIPVSEGKTSVGAAITASPVMIPVSEGKASAGAANTASPVMIPVSEGKASAGAANTASPVMIPVSEGKASAGAANTASPVMIPVSECKASAGAANTASPVMIPVSDGKASVGAANTASPVSVPVSEGHGEIPASSSTDPVVISNPEKKKNVTDNSDSRTVMMPIEDKRGNVKYVPTEDVSVLVPDERGDVRSGAEPISVVDAEPSTLANDDLGNGRKRFTENGDEEILPIRVDRNGEVEIPKAVFNGRDVDNITVEIPEGVAVPVSDDTLPVNKLIKTPYTTPVVFDTVVSGVVSEKIEEVSAVQTEEIPEAGVEETVSEPEEIKIPKTPMPVAGIIPNKELRFEEAPILSKNVQKPVKKADEAAEIKLTPVKDRDIFAKEAPINTFESDPDFPVAPVAVMEGDEMVVEPIEKEVRDTEFATYDSPAEGVDEDLKTSKETVTTVEHTVTKTVTEVKPLNENKPESKPEETNKENAKPLIDLSKIAFPEDKTKTVKVKAKVNTKIIKSSPNQADKSSSDKN